MERLEFDEIADLGNLMYELASEEDAVATAVLFYDRAQDLLKWLLEYDDVSVGHIDLQHEDYGYSKEYYITLDSDLVLDIQPAYDKSVGYVETDTDVIFFDGDSNSRIAVTNDNCLQFELVFEDNCGCDCDNCELNEFVDLLEFIFFIMED